MYIVCVRVCVCVYRINFDIIWNELYTILFLIVCNLFDVCQIRYFSKTFQYVSLLNIKKWFFMSLFKH